uniref:Uncharacterized protein n=1 Tax=Rhizophora mucronata TaxID=61149 RepID=A0A2P2KV56_RHIMU
MTQGIRDKVPPAIIPLPLVFLLFFFSNSLRH